MRTWADYELRIDTDTLGPAQWPSPLRMAQRRGQGLGTFILEGTFVRHRVELRPDDLPDMQEFLFEKAGPRERLYFEPSKVRAAIVTCGGLCPGLNNVVRSLFLELTLNYGVPEVLGIRNGYLGLTGRPGTEPIPLTLRMVSDIHLTGGTILGSSRGRQDVAVMADFLVQQKIDMLFCVGGDGTQRGALELAGEVRRRGLRIALVGVPKTIDNDLGFCDRTFGFRTAVDAAKLAIRSAHVEAKGNYAGVGLVKLMGRAAGFIAAEATLACQEVNYCLIPEIPFALEGPGGLLEVLAERMTRRGHAVIVVAEGAGQHLFDEPVGQTDASGNPRHHDIGPYLRDRIKAHFAATGQPIDIKYIDPSYIIRSVPATTSDGLLCDQLARRAAHAAMAGKTDLVVSRLNNNYIHVPIPMAISVKRRVDPEGEQWSTVLAATGQPARFGPPA